MDLGAITVSGNGDREVIPLETGIAQPTLKAG
jgi:hypothetical protein